MSQHHVRIKNDPRWKAARAAALERDGHECQWPGCGDTGEDRPLEAHHIAELADNPELAFEVDNLITYCRPHHVEAGRESVGLTRNTWIAPDYLDQLEGLVAFLEKSG